MNNHPILLVEDNPDDLLLTLRALKKGGIPNEVVIVRDGVEALDFLFPDRSHKRPVRHHPDIVEP
jgi:two-component system response regulator